MLFLASIWEFSHSHSMLYANAGNGMHSDEGLRILATVIVGTLH